MKGEKVTIINGEVCRNTRDYDRTNQNDASLLLPLSGSSIGRTREGSFFQKKFLGVSLFFLIMVGFWISIGVLLFFFKNTVLMYLFHLLTFIISLFTSEYSRIYTAYKLINDNVEERGRLEKFLSLNPVLMFSSFDLTSLTIMVVTFVFLGMPLLSMNHIVNYEKLSPKWKKSLVAISGPLSFLFFGGFLGLVFNVGTYCSGIQFNYGYISQALFLGSKLLAFLTILNIIPFPPITDGFMAISPYLPDWVNLEISNSRNTILFLILCTLLFIFISQSKLVADIVDFTVSNIYMVKI